MTMGTITGSSVSAAQRSTRSSMPASAGKRVPHGRSKSTETWAQPPSNPPHRRRRWLGGCLRRWARRAFTIGLIMATATICQQNSIGPVPTVATAVAVGTVAILAGRRKRPAHWPRISFIIGVLLVGGLASATWSYNSYLDAPGAATTSVRTSDWMRDHGMSPIVDRLEQYLYAGQTPGNGHISPTQIPSAAIAGTVRLPAMTGAPTPIPARRLIDKWLKGEGKWTPDGRLVQGHPVAYTTFIRPDRTHTDVVASAVWFDPTATRVTYVPGTKQPGNWAWKSGIPAADRPNLVAAFNAGFKFKDIPGGYRTEGRTPVPLMDGQASLVLRSDGSAEIGAWGTEVKMGSDVISVRQNLQLVVDNGRPVSGLHSSTRGQWGSRRWQLQHTNRSGIGITPNHALIYVAGSNLTTESLGDALAKLGCVRAMELDIHAVNPTFNFFSPGTSGGAVTGTKLTQSMQSSATRFLAPDQRDFFAVTLTQPVSANRAGVAIPTAQPSPRSR